MNNLEEGQIVLCTVDKILGTTVFVKIEGYGEGILTTSEIAPGRIRNLRDYVVPGKKIVCKVLSIRGDRINLSLRRVKQNEKKELLETISKEKRLRAMLKTVLGEKAELTISKITEKYNLLDFFNTLKESPKILEEFISKLDAEKIIKILDSKKDKEKELKQIFNLSSKENNGVVIVKEIITSSINKNSEVSYIAAGKYRIKMKGAEFKELKTQLNSLLENIEKLAKKHKAEFSIEKN